MNYRKIYATLCAACSDAIAAIDCGNTNSARNLLQKALWDAEEAYITSASNLLQEIMGEHYILENERLMADASASVPEDVSKRCLETIEKAFQED